MGVPEILSANLLPTYNLLDNLAKVFVGSINRVNRNRAEVKIINKSKHKVIWSVSNNPYVIADILGPGASAGRYTWPCFSSAVACISRAVCWREDGKRPPACEGQLITPVSQNLIYLTSFWKFGWLAYRFAWQSATTWGTVFSTVILWIDNWFTDIRCCFYRYGGSFPFVLPQPPS